MNGQQKNQPTTLTFELVEAGDYSDTSSVYPANYRYDSDLSYGGYAYFGFRPALFL